tara:strand:+ start:1314 stop:1724 length:411 start_codon:yes stop_codon:yes gene_type:complete
MIKYRPHHFFCTLGFQGKGYSREFIKNFSTIKQNLTDETVIKVTTKTDDICAPCPHRRGTLCEKQSKIEALDRAHSTALDVFEGDEITWREAKKRLASFSLEDHHRICKGCQWLDDGLCAQALHDLKGSSLTQINL